MRFKKVFVLVFLGVFSDSLQVPFECAAADGNPPQGGRGALKRHEAVVEEAVAEEAVEPHLGAPEPPPGPSEPNT